MVFHHVQQNIAKSTGLVMFFAMLNKKRFATHLVMPRVFDRRLRSHVPPRVLASGPARHAPLRFAV